MGENKKTETNQDWEELKKWQEKQDEGMQKKYGFDLNEEKLKERTKTMAKVGQVMNKVVKTQTAITAIIIAIMFIIAMVYFATEFINARQMVENIPKPQEIVNDVKELQNN